MEIYFCGRGVYIVHGSLALVSRFFTICAAISASPFVGKWCYPCCFEFGYLDPLGMVVTTQQVMCVVIFEEIHANFSPKSVRNLAAYDRLFYLCFLMRSSEHLLCFLWTRGHQNRKFHLYMSKTPWSLFVLWLLSLGVPHALHLWLLALQDPWQ